MYRHAAMSNVHDPLRQTAPAWLTPGLLQLDCSCLQDTDIMLSCTDAFGELVGLT